MRVNDPKAKVMITDKLVKVRQELIDTANQFPSIKREEVLFDKWTLKDILAHLSGWAIFTSDCIKKFKTKSLPFWNIKINDFNQQSVNNRQRLSWQQTLDEFIKVSQTNIDEYKSLESDISDKKIWPNKSYTPSKFFEIDVNHYQKHLEAIKDKL